MISLAEEKLLYSEIQKKLFYINILVYILFLLILKKYLLRYSQF